jgi:hypothetical protein
MFGAEIGVWKGELSEILLREFPELNLLMVDPWLENPDDPITIRTSVLDAKNEAVRRANAYWNRTTVAETTSLQAAAEAAVRAYKYNFVFIDACHQYQYVREDVRAWYPLVRPGGILCGHDYRGNRPKKWGVVEAVNEFAGELGVAVNREPGNVWWFVKGGK